MAKYSDVTQLDVPAVGRSARNGGLYNACTDKIIRGENVYSKEDLEGQVVPTKYNPSNACDVRYLDRA